MDIFSALKLNLSVSILHARLHWILAVQANAFVPFPEAAAFVGTRMVTVDHVAMVVKAVVHLWKIGNCKKQKNKTHIAAKNAAWHKVEIASNCRKSKEATRIRASATVGLLLVNDNAFDRIFLKSI